MGRYTYSRMIVTDEGSETFTAVEMASFDEAKKEVDRGIYDRKLELEKKYPGVDSYSGPLVDVGVLNPLPTSGAIATERSTPGVS